MAMNALANAAEKAMDAMPTAIHTHLTNPSQQPEFADPSGEKMKALVWEGKMKVKVEEASRPKVVDPKDIVLEVTGTTVCGSDMHLLAGAIIELRKGDILGHECAGRIVEVGSAVKNLKVGQTVVAGFNIACGECFMCQKKLSSACVMTNSSSTMQTMYGGRTCGMLGYSHFTGGFAGGQAEYVRIPYGEANTIKIPDSVPVEDGLFISDVLVTSFHQVEDTGVEEGNVVGIWGVGAIGVLSGVWSAMRGASHLIAIDNAQWRLDHFESVIKRDYPNVRVDTINFDEVKNIPHKIHELTQGGSHGLPETRPAGLDVALECAAGEYAKGWLHKIEMATGLETDTSELLNEMIESTINFGRIGITGVYAAYTNHFNIGSVMQRGIRLIGNGQAPTHKYMQRIMDDYLVTGKIKPREIFVTHRFLIDDIDKVYYSMRNRDPKDQIIKAFVATAASPPPAPGGPPLTRL
ncbi:hypothetical protein JCM3774_006637 [Rhodotorula dairenensis]